MVIVIGSVLGGFQSALPRGERRLREGEVKIYIDISIRAPARGATIYVMVYYNI